MLLVFCCVTPFQSRSRSDGLTRIRWRHASSGGEQGSLHHRADVPSYLRPAGRPPLAFRAPASLGSSAGEAVFRQATKSSHPRPVHKSWLINKSSGIVWLDLKIQPRFKTRSIFQLPKVFKSCRANRAQIHSNKFFLLFSKIPSACVPYIRVFTDI